MAIGGPVAGERQTVPRAELVALKWLLRVTKGSFTIAIDALYVIKGIARIRRGGFPATNTDIWTEVAELLRERAGCIFVHVRSHRNHGALVEGVPPLWWGANCIADPLAEKGAE